MSDQDDDNELRIEIDSASNPVERTEADPTIELPVQDCPVLSQNPAIVSPSTAPAALPMPSVSNIPTVPIQYPKLSRLEEQGTLKEEVSLVKDTKVICSLDLFLELFKYCRHPGCANQAIIKHHTIGPTLIVNWKCSSGHQGKFTSSKDVNDMYVNNLQTAAAILLSGNSFFKIEKMARFMGLSFFSDATFYRVQRLYLIPVVNKWWSWQREQILKDFINKEVIVCGDGQCDSPGHTAKNLCYFLMELVSGYILDVEVKDKRHVNLVSVNMEKRALQSALQRLKGVLNVVEIVTDASSTIKKLIGKIQQAILNQVYHSYFILLTTLCSSTQSCIKNSWLASTLYVTRFCLHDCPIVLRQSVCYLLSLTLTIFFVNEIDCYSSLASFCRL